ncbi:MAG: CaiB/BaiF CoA-transferase family protein [Dehalococcoidales bacterium]|nr:CaiB/BaiF CoA-transferase family protein [Dehalococcoidales bacterium]
MGGVLTGYRVLDLTDDIGVFCGRLFADMGAEVIRIQHPQSTVIEQSASDCYLNLGKRSITLNLETDRGREIYKKLAEDADIIIETCPPGYLDALELGYPQLRRLNPRLVMASLTGFGQNGLYRNYKLSDLTLSALGGQMYVCGEADMPPLKPFGNQTYYTASLYAAIGIMLAIQERHASGKGQHIDISAFECAAATLDHVLVRYFYEGTVAKRQGSLHWNKAFRIFPCQDGDILLSLFQQWDTLVELLAAEGMADDLTEPKWRDTGTRRQHLDHVIVVLERWTRKHKVAELVELGQFMHFPWAAVTSIPELLENPQCKERGFFAEVEYAGRKGTCPGAAIKLSGSPWQVGEHAPAVGADNEEVYQKQLGISPSEVARLKRDSII